MSTMSDSLTRMVLATAACVTLAVSLGARGATAVPATDLRSGRVDSDGAIGLMTVPLFVVPTGYRFVLTDFSWSPGKYPTSWNQPSSFRAGVWIQDGVNNVRWYQSAVLSSSSGNVNASPQISWQSGLVFEQSEVVTVGVSLVAVEAWTASWSGYVESVSLSAVEPSPEALALEAFPNPSGTQVVFQFRLAREGRALLTVFDAKGRKIRSVIDQSRAAGWNAVEWDGRDDQGRLVHAGSYFARLHAGKSRITEKLIQIK